jgi:hypothetical protein
MRYLIDKFSCTFRFVCIISLSPQQSTWPWARDDNGLGSGWVEQKPTHDRTCEVYRNPPAIKPAGEIPNLHTNPSGFGWVLGRPQVFT